jgi:hypothetical protein
MAADPVPIWPGRHADDFDLIRRRAVRCDYNPVIRRRWRGMRNHNDIALWSGRVDRASDDAKSGYRKQCGNRCANRISN